jgi:arginine/lysine/ornithine decarboxylase
MLTDKLRENSTGGDIPMHMPGHKRNTDMLGRDLPYDLDITEIPGFDDLHDMRGVLAETSAIAAEVYGVRRAFPLINGTTGGILAAISALTTRGDTVIMARNCHKSVYNAVEINMLTPRYVLPERTDYSGVFGSVTPEAISDALRANPSARLVVITSPTYDGVISDVRGIAKVAHEHGAMLLTDAAHGAHLRFTDELHGADAACGDVTVMSLHKTLPALTQCSLLLCGGDMTDADAVARQLAVYESSSPSYVLLASIDKCVRLLRERADELFGAYLPVLDAFYDCVRGLKTLRVDDMRGTRGVFGFDRSKILISTAGSELRGGALYDMLRREYKIVAEMYGVDYVIALSSVCDTRESLSALTDALIDIDGKIQSRADGEAIPQRETQNLPTQKLPPWQARALSGQYVKVSDCVGRVSLEYLYAYPPGVPILAPGELADDNVIAELRDMESAGIELRSTMGKPGLLLTADESQRGD